MASPPNILITGASGFIGRNLAKELLSRRKKLRGLYHAPPSMPIAGVETATGDLLQPETLLPALQGIDCAYYLVHSLQAGRQRFRELDRQAAENFVAAAEQAKVRRVIYLSGLGQSEPELSAHLGSRSEVAEILAQGSFQTTTLRAAIIIGAGGASFELLRYLVKTQLMLLDSALLDTRCQPIALPDVLHYLADCLDEEKTSGETFDIGGPEILSYRELLDHFAKVGGDINLFLPVPHIPPKLVGAWVGLLSRQKSAIVEALLEGLHNEVICHDQRIRDLFPFTLTPLDDAIASALQEREHGRRAAS